MTVSHLSTRLSLVLAGLALVTTACADVGSGSSSSTKQDVPGGGSTDQDTIVCQSIRQAMQQDKKAAAKAEAAGNKAEAARRNDAVLAGAEGAKSVKGCDVSDLVATAKTTAAPTPS